jgi:hypothetical protein
LIGCFSPISNVCVSHQETLIAGARPSALTINARGADPEMVARCDIFHVLRTREQRRDVAVAQQARSTGAVLEIDNNTGGIR